MNYAGQVGISEITEIFVDSQEKKEKMFNCLTFREKQPQFEESAPFCSSDSLRVL